MTNIFFPSLLFSVNTALQRPDGKRGCLGYHGYRGFIFFDFYEFVFSIFIYNEHRKLGFQKSEIFKHASFRYSPIIHLW